MRLTEAVVGYEVGTVVGDGAVKAVGRGAVMVVGAGAVGLAGCGVMAVVGAGALGLVGCGVMVMVGAGALGLVGCGKMPAVVVSEVVNVLLSCAVVVVTTWWWAAHLYNQDPVRPPVRHSRHPIRHHTLSQRILIVGTASRRLPELHSNC